MKVRKLQAGGAAPAAPAGGEGATNPQDQLAEMAMQIIQQLGPEASAALAQMIMELLQQGGGAQQEAPVYARKGGKLVLVKKQ
ncbi:MAG: hypothetical protein JXM74_08690 [Fusobacteriaceae bacterium]|nr:hypothetical protein [Fusobacteriaceae bacterium]